MMNRNSQWRRDMYLRRGSRWLRCMGTVEIHHHLCHCIWTLANSDGLPPPPAAMTVVPESDVSIQTHGSNATVSTLPNTFHPQDTRFGGVIKTTSKKDAFVRLVQHTHLVTTLQTCGILSCGKAKHIANRIAAEGSMEQFTITMIADVKGCSVAYLL